MQTVNMHEAKTQLSKLVARAAAGEVLIVAKGGKPAARGQAGGRACSVGLPSCYYLRPRTW